MHATRSAELTLVSGDGVHVTDDEGRRYLDATASLWNVNVGHGRTELADAAAAQMRELATYGAFGSFTNQPARELTDRLADLAPVDGARIFLTSGGGDSIDTAAKLARRYFAATGQPERVHLISRSQGYHGTHGLGTSLGGIAANRVDVGPLDPHASQVPHDSLEALEAEIERVGADRVAAVFVEPVIGAGGVHQPLPGYLEGRRRALQAHRRAARGRRRDRRLRAPGRVVRARALGPAAGHDHVRQGRDERLPPARRRRHQRRDRGAVLGRAEPAVVPPRADLRGAPDVLRGRAGEPRHHRARGPARARARARGPDRGARCARSPRTRSRARCAPAPARSARSRCRPRRSTREPKAPLRVWAHARDRGVLVRPLGDGVAISPALIATREHVDTAATAISDALDAVASELGVTAAA